jgi:hypothetical protein
MVFELLNKFELIFCSFSVMSFREMRRPISYTVYKESILDPQKSSEAPGSADRIGIVTSQLIKREATLL